MKRIATLSLLCLTLVTAQSNNVRIITIDSPNGGTVSGNPRTGPLTFENPKPGGVVGRVKDLQITSSKAILEAPPGKTLDESKGERTATFQDNITVKRDRMTATGPKLVYSEKTGQGVLEGPARMRQEPKDKDADPVEVTANKMTFDVDTDISTSEGNVSLKNGRQEGKSDTVYYEEKRGLAVFTDKDQVALVRHRSDGDLIIRAKEVRSLTEDKRLIATGGVTLVDGNITTTGASLSYDDKTGIAFITGNARSENKKEGLVITGPTLQHNVNKHIVVNYTKPYQLPAADFKRTGEK
ncbi:MULTISPECIES: LptA/OstA family protein [unclassified Meiothermus]|uniref:LptA/OstA family protein n=1 Tax=unclassified Meiothermus TaxID=370471 RepID=UPI000D7CA146|nr:MULTISPECIES: LptA/OstA family protein [unclassified Meiothermus]PZA07906.1 OstA family protein [Meiothermus sp. Pnk-1]RYM38782.1 OstA family protein [Meiothermus sp. PNK-Is4]